MPETLGQEIMRLRNLVIISQTMEKLQEETIKKLSDENVRLKEEVDELKMCRSYAAFGHV